MSGQPAPVADLEVSGHLADDCSLSRVGVVLDRRRVAVAGQIDDDVWTRQVIDHRLPGGAVGGQAMQEDDGGRAPGPNGRDVLREIRSLEALVSASPDAASVDAVFTCDDVLWACISRTLA